MKIRKILAVLLSASLIATSIQIPAFAGQLPAEKEESAAGAAALYEAEEKEAVTEEELLQEETEEATLSENRRIVLTAVTDDGVTVTMKAEEAAFISAKPASPSDAEGADQEDSFDPALLELKADTIETAEEEAVDKALEGETESDNIASRKTYDIYVLYDGEKIEPLPGKKAEVSFTLPEAPSGADEVKVYHHTEEGVKTIIDEKIADAEEQNTAESNAAGEAGKEAEEESEPENAKNAAEDAAKDAAEEEAIVVTGETDSFSLYTIDFTYNEKTISIPGGTDHKELADILKEIEITEVIKNAAAYQDAACTELAAGGTVKNEKGDALFKVYEEDGVWYVDAINSFDTEHGLYIKTENAKYKIKVTDPSSGAATVTVNGITTHYDTISEAWAAAQEAGTATVQLLADVSANLTNGSGKVITLDLNGHVLQGSGRVIYVKGESSTGAGDAGKLAITDSNTEDLTHYFKYSKTSAWTLYDEAKEEDKNKAIAVDAITGSTTDGTLIKVPGGVITGGNNSGYVGGGVYIEPGCTLTMTGVSICGNKAKQGGGLYIPANTTVKFEDVTIVGNHATNGYGGMLFNANKTGILTMDGIVKILWNISDTKRDNNLTLWDVGTEGALKVDALASGSDIYVTVNDNTTGAVTRKSSGDYSGCFTSDNTDYVAYNEGTGDDQQVKIGSYRARIVETEVKYENVQAAVSAATSGQTVRMIADSQENVSIPSEKTVTLDLDGYVLSGTGSGGVIGNSGTLTIKDSNGLDQTHKFRVLESGLWELYTGADEAAYTYDAKNGLRTSAGEATTDIPGTGSIIAVSGGCITGGNTDDGGGVYTVGKLVINAGNVIGNTAFYGGGVCLENKENRKNFDCTGGSIIGNNAKTFGGGVYSCSNYDISISGGSIAYNISVENGGGVYLKGMSAMSMSAGQISFNRAENSTLKASGGGAYICSDCSNSISGGSISYNKAAFLAGGVMNQGSFTMTGGSINDNTALNGGGVLHVTTTDTPVILGGKAQITGNTATGMGNNLLLINSKIEIGTGDKAPEEEMKVGVTLSNDGQTSGTGQFTTNGTADDAAYFASDVAGYAVVYKEGSDKTGHLELREKCTVTLDGNGATTQGSVKSVTAINGSAMPAITGKGSLPSRTGYIFAGYFDAQTGGNKYYNADGTSAKDWDKTEDTTLYAQWTEKTAPQVSDLTFSASSCSYDGDEHSATFTTDKSGMGAITVKYRAKDATAWSDTAPVKAGLYYVKAVIAEGTSYASAELTSDDWNFTISPKQLSVTGTRADGKTYDGTATAAATIGTVEGIIEKDKAAVSVSVKTAVFDDKDAGNGRTVTVSYSLTGTQAGNYTVPTDSTTTADIEKRAVTLTSASASKTYDGLPLTDSTVTASGEGFVTGEGATYTVTGSQTLAGTSKNTFTYELKSGTKADNYTITTVEGDLTITAITTPIIITTASDTKVYDGTALANDGYTFTDGVLLNGDVLSAVVTGTITDAGTAANTVASYKVMQGSTDVTDCYTFGTFAEGTLTVKKRAITLTSGSATKAYDGKPLTKNEVEDSLTGEADQAGFVTGEGASYTVTGSQTEVGTSANTFSYTLKEGTKAANYTITKSEGVLKVLEAEKCIVTFEMNDHGTQVPVQYEVRGRQISRPQDPTEEGWSFKGWYKEDMETAWDFLSDTVQEDMTLYARWTEGDHTVRFEGSEISDLCVRHNEIITLPQAEKSGYEFLGWLKNGDEAVKLYGAESSYKVTENVSFTASFAIKKEIVGKEVRISDASEVDTSKAGKGSNETEALIIRQVSEAKLAADYPIDISSNLRESTLESYLNEAPSANELLFKLNVKLTNVYAEIQKTSTTTELTFNVTPVFYAMENGVAVSSEQVVSNSDIHGSVKFCLTMPTSALAVAEVKHMASDGRTVKDVKYYDVQTITNEDGVTEKYIEAESGSFSDFVITFIDTRPQPKTDDDDAGSSSQWWKSTDAGWLVKPGTNDWYYIKNHALVKGWYKDSEDGYWYYLDPVSGRMLIGWVKLGDKWYYLNQKASQQTWYKDSDGKWHYKKDSTTKPYGSMYCNETTPDGYVVDQNGAWDGKAKKQ